MNIDELKRAINIRETIKLYFVAIGRYTDFIRSYARNKDGSWGYNPNNPAHPMRKYFNEHFMKEA